MSSSNTTKHGASIDAWSISIPPKPLPPVSQIKSICVVDFDNTLYQSPIPSNIWESSSINILRDKDHLLGGGWWQTPSILDATIGPDKPDKNSTMTHSRRFPNRWNAQMIRTALNAQKDPQTLTVLLTGRNRKLFSQTILRILEKGGMDFDLVVLKQNNPEVGEEFPSTMAFKQHFLSALLKYFHHAERMSIYEDRMYHVKKFRTFAESFNANCDRQLHPSKIKFDVKFVPETHWNLEPVEEIKQVKFMLQRHNKLAQSLGINPRPPPARLFKRVYNTAYMLSRSTTTTLLQKFPIRSTNGPPYTEYFARYLRIKKGKCEPAEIERLGGLGAQVEFETVSFGSLNSSIWAVKVQPVVPGLQILTADSIPAILIAKKSDIGECEMNGIKEWENIQRDDPRYLRFSTTIGEQLRLQISATRTLPAQDNIAPSLHRWQPSAGSSDNPIAAPVEKTNKGK
ncbi:hypothetical protein AA313_de0204994 [Arthrobotrys entomopaga]|nr:hypothetical protein AA313_de0204994 [Arthrobotrys entomopaga]